MQVRMFEVSDGRKINPFSGFASIKLGPFNKPAIQAKTKYCTNHCQRIILYDRKIEWRISITFFYSMFSV